MLARKEDQTAFFQLLIHSFISSWRISGIQIHRTGVHSKTYPAFHVCILWRMLEPWGPWSQLISIFGPFSVQTSSDWLFFFFSSESAGVWQSTEQILSPFWWWVEFFTCTVQYSGSCFNTGSRHDVNQKIWGDYELEDNKVLSLKGRMTDTFNFQLL